jgi:hypothetical protein
MQALPASTPVSSTAMLRPICRHGLDRHETPVLPSRGATDKPCQSYQNGAEEATPQRAFCRPCVEPGWLPLRRRGSRKHTKTIALPPSIRSREARRGNGRTNRPAVKMTAIALGPLSLPKGHPEETPYGVTTNRKNKAHWARISHARGRPKPANPKLRIRESSRSREMTFETPNKANGPTAKGHHGGTESAEANVNALKKGT